MKLEYKNLHIWKTELLNDKQMKLCLACHWLSIMKNIEWISLGKLTATFRIACFGLRRQPAITVVSVFGVITLFAMN